MSIATVILPVVLAAALIGVLRYLARRVRSAAPGESETSLLATVLATIVATLQSANQPQSSSMDQSSPAAPSQPREGSPRRASAPTVDAPASSAAHVEDAPTWGYQLQNLDLARAAASPFDIIVIDTTKDGSDDTVLTPSDVARLKRKPDGSPRQVLAYLSIGEAESYRSYWNTAWKRAKPEWLLGENPDWKENYAVCFWHPDWQRVMCGAPDARLDRILAAGFDGVYLDKCDVYDDLERRYKSTAASRPDIEGDMVELIAKLSRYAKARDPDFLIVMQNAEDLLERPDLRAILDGVAKEELVYGADQPEKLNSTDDFRQCCRLLDLMRGDGKLVLVVEYLGDLGKIRHAVQAVSPLGYALYISAKNRKLDRLEFDTLLA